MTYAQGPTTLGNLSCTFSDLSLLYFLYFSIFYFYGHKFTNSRRLRTSNLAVQALPIQEKAYGPDSLEPQ